MKTQRITRMTGSIVEYITGTTTSVRNVATASPQITATTDSLQFCWITRDVSQEGEFSWGKHGSVQHLVDNVSIGSFDATGTIFLTRNIDIFADTFSRSDPAHTPFLQNPEMGMWTNCDIGAGSNSISGDAHDPTSARQPTLRVIRNQGACRHKEEAALHTSGRPGDPAQALERRARLL